MGTFLPAPSLSDSQSLRLSPWIGDILAGLGLLVFLASTFAVATLLG
jgi:hypothetical protein